MSNILWSFSTTLRNPERIPSFFKTICEKIKIKNVSLTNLDLEKFDYSKLEKPFFYCDPPYLITDATYNESGGWTEKDEKRLLAFLNKLNENQIPFALTKCLKF